MATMLAGIGLLILLTNGMRSCETSQMTYITLYENQFSPEVGFASAICKDAGTGYLPLINTQEKLLLYRSIHLLGWPFLKIGGGFWTNASRVTGTESYYWDDYPECSELPDNSTLWHASADLDDAQLQCTRFKYSLLSSTYGLVPIDCSTASPLSLPVCERISGDACVYEKHTTNNVCPAYSTEIGQQSFSNIGLKKCKDKCNTYSNGEAECWAILNDQDINVCTLLYFVNPLHIDVIWTSTVTCHNIEYHHKRCYTIQSSPNIANINDLCPQSCSINSTCMDWGSAYTTPSQLTSTTQSSTSPVITPHQTTTTSTVTTPQSATTTSTVTAPQSATTASTVTTPQSDTTASTVTTTQSATTTSTVTTPQSATTTSTVTAPHRTTTASTVTTPQSAMTTSTVTTPQSAMTVSTGTTPQSDTTASTVTTTQSATTTSTVTTPQSATTISAVTTPQSAMTVSTGTTPQSAMNTSTVTTPQSAMTTSTVTTPQSDTTASTVTTPQSATTTSTVTTPQSAMNTSTVTTPQSAMTTSTVTTPQSDTTASTVTTPQSATTTSTVTTPQSAMTTSTVTTPQSDTTASTVTTPQSATTTSTVTTPQSATTVSTGTTPQSATTTSTVTTPQSATTSSTVTTPQSATTACTGTTPQSAMTMSTVNTPQSATTPSTCPNCHCSHLTTGNDTSLTLEELIFILTIDVKDTSAFRRTKNSAEDNRQGAKTVGMMGVALIILFGILIILSDVTNFCTRRNTHDETMK